MYISFNLTLCVRTFVANLMFVLFTLNCEEMRFCSSCVGGIWVLRAFSNCLHLHRVYEPVVKQTNLAKYNLG